MHLSVIIVNYNVKYFLEQCLCSVKTACRNIDAEIFVIDNNSTDGSSAFLEPKFPEVNFIWNSGNMGFAKANNQALSVARGDYILFLNPDTIVPEDCFEKCIGFFKANPNTGALGVHMIDGTGNFLKESKRSYPSPLTSLYKLTGLTRMFPRSKTLAKYYLGNLSENENHEVDVLAGAFMMAPKTVLATTGGFDEMFFMYAEDIDLSYRIQKAGFANFYFSETSIIHFKGESTQKGSLHYVRMFYKAMGLFVKKHYSTGRAGIFNILIWGGIFLRGLFSFIAKMLQQAVLFISQPLRGAGDESKEMGKTIILSNEKEFEVVTAIMQKAGIEERVLGRVDNGKGHTENELGSVRHLPEFLKRHPIKEIIFCEEGLGFASIIKIIQELPHGIRNKFHASGSSGIVGSDSKDLSGAYITG